MDGYLARFVGGPFDGETRIAPRSMGWPLPDVFPVVWENGCYLKQSESQLPAEIDDNPHIARGAQYEWESDQQ